MSEPREILEAAQTILLVDWPNPGVPRALVNAGFTVFSFSPGRYSTVEVLADQPDDADAGRIFPPQSDDESGYLVFRPMAARPSHVDVVNAYRPLEEIPGIVANHVLPLGAKVLWLQSPGDFAEARRIATAHGIAFVEGSDIGEVARSIQAARR